MNSDWNTEQHPAWYRDLSTMHTLILGSFPPHPSKWAYPFYYPNWQNRFWKILAELAGETLIWTKTDQLKAVEERYEIMKKLGIGVQNLGFEIERKGTSALDTDIRIIQFHDILSIIEAHPELTRILLPGYSAENSTTKSFLRYLKDKGIRISDIPPIKAEASFKIYVEDREIECVILNSTSTAAKIRYDVLLEQFKRYLKVPGPLNRNSVLFSDSKRKI
jgi:G:T/U-mismatch repair DNA glycosylase